MTLDGMTPYSTCRVKRVRGGHAVSQRLMEMGLIDGSTVEVVRTAPLGDPIELHLHGYNLSLRKSEAALVEVEHCQ